MGRQLDRNIWLVSAIALFIMFFNLGGIPLLDPDEPVYAQTPKEMARFNEFLSPRIYGEYWYDKPPLYYWLVAGAGKVLGMSEFAARFPSAFLGAAGVLALYLFGCELFNKRAGLAGALVLATSLEYVYLGKAAVTDMTLTFCLTLALLGFITKRYYLMYIFAGLATVAKGPVGFLFPGAVIFLYLAITGRFRLLAEMKLPAGMVLFAVIGLPWYWFMYSVHGSAFIDTFLGFHNVTRFTSPEHPELVVWYYFIPVLLIGFFPWTAILAQSVWASLRRGSQADSRTLVFLNIWAAFIFLFFSICQTKLVSYILPLYPPLALIAGWYIDKVWDLRAKITAWPVLLALLSTLFATGMVAGMRLLPGLTYAALTAAATLGSMALGSVIFIRKRQPGKAFGVQVTGMALCLVVIFGLLLPPAAPFFTAKYIAQEFTARYDRQAPVYVMKFLRPGFAYYTDVYGTEVKTLGLAAAVAGAPGSAWFVVQQADYRQLTAADRDRVNIVAQVADRMILVKK